MARKKKSTSRRGRVSTRKTRRKSNRKPVRRKASVRKTATRKAPARRGRRSSSSDLSAVPVEQLQQELAARLPELEQRRTDLQAALAEADDLIARIGGLVDGSAPTRRRGPGRPPKATAGATSSAPRRKLRGGAGRRRKGERLVDMLHDVMKGRDMTVGEAMDAVQAAGYVSNSPNFRVMVNQTLSANKKQFKRVSRGIYRGL